MNAEVTSLENDCSAPSLPRPTVYLIDREPTTRANFVQLCRAVDCDLISIVSVADFFGIESWVRPACLVCDLSMLEESGFDLKSEMLRRGCNMPVLFVSDHRDVDVAARVTGQGGWTLIRKPFEISRVDHLIVSATESDRRSLELEAMQSATEASLALLTERQRGILGCVVEGLPTRVIARQYGVSTRLIELERSELLKAFGVPTTPDLTLKMGEYRVLQRLSLRTDQSHFGLPRPSATPREVPAADARHG